MPQKPARWNEQSPVSGLLPVPVGGGRLAAGVCPVEFLCSAPWKLVGRRSLRTRPRAIADRPDLDPTRQRTAVLRVMTNDRQRVIPNVNDEGNREFHSSETENSQEPLLRRNSSGKSRQLPFAVAEQVPPPIAWSARYDRVVGSPIRQDLSPPDRIVGADENTRGIGAIAATCNSRKGQYTHRSGAQGRLSLDEAIARCLAHQRLVFIPVSYRGLVPRVGWCRLRKWGRLVKSGNGPGVNGVQQTRDDLARNIFAGDDDQWRGQCGAVEFWSRIGTAVGICGDLR